MYSSERLTGYTLCKTLCKTRVPHLSQGLSKSSEVGNFLHDEKIGALSYRETLSVHSQYLVLYEAGAT